jgi:hypothetical protein
VSRELLKNSGTVGDRCRSDQFSSFVVPSWHDGLYELRKEDPPSLLLLQLAAHGEGELFICLGRISPMPNWHIRLKWHNKNIFKNQYVLNYYAIMAFSPFFSTTSTILTLINIFLLLSRYNLMGTTPRLV